MTRNRSGRTIFASVMTVLWLGYMVFGLAWIEANYPTVGGEGPEGLAAFVGLIWGVIVTGAIMWAASDD
ncbi:MAG TPA: hypothetical protein VFH63_08940 [candidate division Zixibacteria bacterium]|nr:hypothetical protein [candidate division Zixibacteria bacterium]